MPYNPTIHHRRSIRLKGYDYSQAGMYFVTICCQNHISRFGKIENGEMMLNEFGNIVNNEWQYLTTKYPHITLHEYIIMPNHFHGIVEIGASAGAGFARPDETNARPDETNARPNDMGDARPNDMDDGDTGAGKPRPCVPTLGNIIGYFKYQTTKKIDLPVKLWQRNYWEIIIRNDKSYQHIANYIIKNPKKWENDRFFMK